MSQTKANDLCWACNNNPVTTLLITWSIESPGYVCDECLGTVPVQFICLAINSQFLEGLRED